MCTPKIHKTLTTKILTIFAAFCVLTMASSLKAIAKTMDDAEIIGLINAINENEINAAKAASKKETNQEVLGFADLMQKEHSKNMDKTLELGKKMNITPAESDAVKDEKQKGEKELSKLDQLNGDQFGKAYIDSMIKDHTEALNMIDKDLLKNVQSEELRTHLNDTRNHVSMHLDQAKKIKDDLKG
jgi:putative membrane protein